MAKVARRLRRSMPRGEAEWLAASDPLAMLEVLRARASDRKVRLFAVGCCRLTLTDSAPERTLRAVEVAERFADGLADREELLRARSSAFHAVFKVQSRLWDEAVARGEQALRRTLTDEECGLYFAAETAHPHTPFRIGWLRHRLRWDGRLMRVAPAVLREVVGHPFDPPAIDSRWRTTGVAALARRIYDERSFGAMPDLADALEGAGCHDAEILGHCRGKGPHVRGCWVLDALLGRS